MNKQITCRECGAQAHFLLPHLDEAHGMTVADYLSKHPGALTVSASLAARWDSEQKNIRRTPAPSVDTLTVDFAGVPMSVNQDVPETDCLPLPAHYRFPQHGALAEDLQDTAIALASGRSIYISGPQGTGKDAAFHAFSSLTRTPAAIFNVQPGVDVSHWFFSRSFNERGTAWEEGLLITSLVNGYETSQGKRIPMFILVTDFDRADRAQAESLRLVLDSIAGRVKGPNGVTYPVLAGTRIVVTANTTGGGDTTGRYVSANPIDSSLLDRFERKFAFHAMAWQDEEAICKDKFPLLVEKCPGVFKQVGLGTQAIRAAIASEDLFCEFSHRAVCGWLGMAEDIVRVTGKVPVALLKRAARVFLDGLPDETHRADVLRLIDPALKGGSLETGTSSFNEHGDLLNN